MWCDQNDKVWARHCLYCTVVLLLEKFYPYPTSINDWGGGLEWCMHCLYSDIHARKDKTHRRKCKMSSSKKRWPVRDFAAGVYLSEAQNLLPPPLYTLYTCTYSIVYLFTQGRGEGGELNKREGLRGNSSQSWEENTNTTDCISW